MAQSGAQLSSMNALEHGLPSIFEVIAQESLISTLRPAMKHILRVMAQGNPERFSFLYRYSDELYTSLQLILENYYLKHYNASFSENFYGLKRVSMKATNTGAINKDDQSGPTDQADIKAPPTFPHLSRSQHWKSMIFLVLVPYLKNKCDLLYEGLSSSQYNDSQVQSQTLKSKLCRAFMAIYPVVHGLWQGTLFLHQMAYVFGRSLHHSPFLRWSGVLLKNLTEDDLKMFSLRTDPVSVTELMKNKRWWKALILVLARVVGFSSMMLSSGLSVGIFFLQFLDWWYARDRDASSLLALPKPERPKQHSLTSLPQLTTICPLCNKVRTNDTVLSVTGYVFCYPCIYKYVQEKRSCPMTGYPATTDHLVKLFLTDV